ncbi:MAG: hypothetical protein JXO72_05415 [Vicinamibacteria bacterium]|nr:hypothetical protein [Vicinamibacteria bacterium]
MPQIKIVAHYQDGRLVKGFTNDFLPTKDRLHIVPMEAPPSAHPVEVQIKDLKAIFFVKDFLGDSQHQDKNEFDPRKPTPGRKLRVVFKDGEVMMGTTQGYQPGRPSFFLVPADTTSNAERCFIVAAATQEVAFVQ